MIIGRWYMQSAAVWYWLLPIYIYIDSAHSFFSSSVFFNVLIYLVSINQTECSTIPS